MNYSCEPPTAKGLAVFKDPMSSSSGGDIKRTVSSISWHPEAGKLAVTYAILNFQDARVANARLPPQSYVWDISNPNSPELEINPPSPLCCLKFNPKNADILVGGSYNGLISVYDLRRTGTSGKTVAPIAVSEVENSHHDPVYDIYWINSKTASQCVSVSTDGRVLWWDTRKLDEPPTDSVSLCADARGGGAVLGGCALEYNAEAGPSKYLVGTEQGIVLLANLKNRKQNNGIFVFDQNAGKHHGPIYAIQRNPSNTKCFLTVGDWTAKVWMEDIKTPIMTTKYHAAYVTGGCWSPTRPGVFFVTRADGVVDIWDFHYRQTEVAYSHKVSSTMITSIAVQNSSLSQTGGKLVALGDACGTVTLLELCDSLSTPQPNERKAMDLLFEREIKQEKNLEARERELRRLRTTGSLSAKETSLTPSVTSTKMSSTGTVPTTTTTPALPVVASPPTGATAASNKREPEDMEALLRKLDSEFLAMIKLAEDKESRTVVAEGEM